LRERVLVV